MPLTLSPAFRAHLLGELTTLCTLWEIERIDGAVYYFTDHDTDILYGGNLYETGIGYNRSALEDKADLSVDNIDVHGILDTTRLSRDDVRAGRFDSALVTLTVVNYNSLSTTGVIRRRGWFGEVKQNNRGAFSVELRGLSQALSETLTEVYTPGCRVDLGSVKCKVVLGANERQDDTFYAVSDWVTVAPYNLAFQCITAGTTEGDTSFDPTIFNVSAGATVNDGSAAWLAYDAFAYNFVVTSVTDRRTFEVAVNCPRLGADPAFFDGGLVSFLTGQNAQVAREINLFSPDTGDDGEVSLFLRMPFTVQVGDTGTIYPGCDKTLATCKARFNNVVNFRGFPHIPGDKYLKDYPDTK